MTVIRTKTNWVIAHEPEPGDRYVHVVWFGPSEGARYQPVFQGPPQPLDSFDESVEWALSMADFMRFPIYVTPLTEKDARKLRKELQP